MNSSKEVARNNGLDPETLITSVNGKYFYHAGDNWQREFIAKVSGTAGNLERWVHGSFLEDENGTYDLVYHDDRLNEFEALDIVDEW